MIIDEQSADTLCVPPEVELRHWKLKRPLHTTSKSTLFLAENQHGEKATITFLDRERLIGRYTMLLLADGRTHDEAEREAALWAEKQQRLFQERFDRIKGLHHSNVAECFEIGTDPQRQKIAVVSEYVPGTDLFMATRGLTPLQHLPLFVMVLQGLEYIHSNGLLHLNIKPKRIRADIESEPPIVKFTDFGFALPREGHEGDYTGTALYMAPEVVMNERARIDERADLYSLAATMYYCISRHQLFHHRSRADRDRHKLQNLVRREGPVPPASHYCKDIPAELDQLLLELLEPNPDDRKYRSAGAVLEFIIETWPKESEQMNFEVSTLFSKE
ncbi:MAG: protein kinase [Deltaproteobacteria bacterium]|nr:protein kinase [Deltaproteobacteria bacterium]